MAGPDTKNTGFAHPRPLSHHNDFSNPHLRYPQASAQQQQQTRHNRSPTTPSSAALNRRESLPLLFEMPTGKKKQVNVPVTASVDDLLAALNADDAAPDSCSFLTNAELVLPTDSTVEEEQPRPIKSLSFNGVEMSRGRPISDYNIPAAYGGAASMLRVIGGGDLDLQNAASAIHSTAEVANHICNGVNDVDHLVEAALGGKARAPQSPDPWAGPDQNNDHSTLLRKLSIKAPHLFEAQAVDQLSEELRAQAPRHPTASDEPPRANNSELAATWFDTLSDILGEKELSRKRPGPELLPKAKGGFSAGTTERKVKRKTFAAAYQEKLDSMQSENDALQEEVKKMRCAVSRLQNVLTLHVSSQPS